jgi:hypothetical protein
MEANNDKLIVSKYTNADFRLMFGVSVTPSILLAVFWILNGFNEGFLIAVCILLGVAAFVNTVIRGNDYGFLLGAILMTAVIVAMDVFMNLTISTLLGGSIVALTGGMIWYFDNL